MNKIKKIPLFVQNKYLFPGNSPYNLEENMVEMGRTNIFENHQAYEIIRIF